MLLEHSKKLLLISFLAIVISACSDTLSSEYVITGNNDYEASLFRQNCAICHGAEGEGKTIDDGTVVPSLRRGEFKAVTDLQIYSQIADGGNGMTPFRRQLTDREIKLLVKLVREDLRK